MTDRRFFDKDGLRLKPYGNDTWLERIAYRHAQRPLELAAIERDFYDQARFVPGCNKPGPDRSGAWAHLGKLYFAMRDELMENEITAELAAKASRPAS